MRATLLPEMLIVRAAGALCCAALMTGAIVSMPAAADPVADFYKGKQINLLIGVGVGGEYDLQARLTGRHIGKHIPGNPGVVPQNMTGAGGLKMANYLYAVAAKDGTSSTQLVKAIKPRYMRLTAKFFVRGGIFTNVVVEHRKKGWKPQPKVELSDFETQSNTRG